MLQPGQPSMTTPLPSQNHPLHGGQEAEMVPVSAVRPHLGYCATLVTLWQAYMQPLTPEAGVELTSPPAEVAPWVQPTPTMPHHLPLLPTNITSTALWHRLLLERPPPTASAVNSTNMSSQDTFSLIQAIVEAPDLC